MSTTTTPDTDRGTPAGTGASDATQEAKDRAREAAGQAQEKVHDAADQAKEQASQAGAKAKTRLRDEIDQRSNQAAERAAGTAGDLRSVGQGLRDQGQDGPAKLADQAADRVEQASNYLTGSDADRLLHDLEEFGRKRPWAVIAGGLAVGFAASRVLRASSTDRYRGADGNGNGTTTPPARPTTTTAPGTPGAGSSTAGFAGTATVTSASAPQPGVAGDGTLSDPLSGPPLETGPDPITTTHRERENGLGSDGRL